MNATVTIVIDDVAHRARLGQNLLDACRQAGIDVPTLCHLTGRRERNACRLCLVRLDGQVVTACSTPVAQGQVVITCDDDLMALRRTVIELTLLEHGQCSDPACTVEALAHAYGVPPRARLDVPSPAPRPASDYLIAHIEHCVHCDRCIRSCERQLIHRDDRSTNVRFGFAASTDNGDDCTHCGDCVAACPANVLRRR